MVLVNDSPEIGSHIIQFLERRLHTSFERLFISNFSSALALYSLTPIISYQFKPSTLQFIVVFQSLSHVQLFLTPRTATHHASLSFTISWSLLKLTSFELMMPSNHLILYCLLLVHNYQH